MMTALLRDPRTPLNLLYLGTLPPHPGGSAISCGQLLLGLATAGHNIRAVAPITAEALRSSDRFTAGHPRLSVTRFVLPYCQISSYDPLADEHRRLEREQIEAIFHTLVAAERPDAVVIGRESFAWHVTDLAAAAGLPSLLMIRGGLTHAILDGTYPDTLAEQALEHYRRATRLVTPSRYLAGGLRNLGFDNVEIIPNAVDLAAFSPRPKSSVLLRQLALQATDVVVAHLSNLKSIKRPLDLVNSAVQTLPQEPRLQYLVIGDGPCRSDLERACREAGIFERFRFTGWVDYSQVPEYLSLADLVVMPSEMEAQARAYLETQAVGRLLLASDIPAAREVIADGSTGLLFRRGDVDDLAARTLLAARSPGLRAQIGQQARERVLTHALDRAVAAYVATLEDLIRRRPR